VNTPLLAAHVAKHSAELAQGGDYMGARPPLTMATPRNCSWGARNMFYCKSLWEIFFLYLRSIPKNVI
jgi:hypothetical protein